MRVDVVMRQSPKTGKWRWNLVDAESKGSDGSKDSFLFSARRFSHQSDAILESRQVHEALVRLKAAQNPAWVHSLTPDPLSEKLVGWGVVAVALGVGLFVGTVLL